MPHRKQPKADAVDVSRIDTDALWQAVCRVSADYIAVVDRTGAIRFCNRVDSGWKPDQVIGHSMLDFTMPESTPDLFRRLEEVFTTGRERFDRLRDPQLVEGRRSQPADQPPSL
ncbi:MAG: PAS domain-containing protein, partial [Planctomycetia bacterium]